MRFGLHVTFSAFVQIDKNTQRTQFFTSLIAMMLQFLCFLSQIVEGLNKQSVLTNFHISETVCCMYLFIDGTIAIFPVMSLKHLV